MGIRRWWRARSGRPLEDFDDDHTTATTGAWRAQIGRRRGVLYLGSCRHIEQFPGARDIVFAAGAGQEAVVADAVEALRQNVEQEAANEFVRTEGLAVGTVAAIVLVAERDPGLVERDEPMVRDGDAVGVSRQIGEHRFRPGEWRLGVDDPSLVAERHQVAEEGMSVAQPNLVTEELEAVRCMQLLEVLQEPPPEQLGEHANRQQGSGAGRDPPLATE